MKKALDKATSGPLLASTSINKNAAQAVPAPKGARMEEEAKAPAKLQNVFKKPAVECGEFGFWTYASQALNALGGEPRYDLV